MSLLRLGTRGSKLAMAQAVSVSAQLEAANPGLKVQIVPIKTSGDRGQRDIVGAFVREIQRALLDNEIDAALHCLKDLPVEVVAGLEVASYLEREDARDTFISRYSSFEELPSGAVVGCGSVRRSSQLAAVRPDLVYRPIMGNVDTRLGKLLSGEYDGIILAIAGLKRLGLLDVWSSGDYAELHVSLLETDLMLPAPAQAVLALEARADDAETRGRVSALNDACTELSSKAERAFLKGFGGGCSVPVAALAWVEGESLLLEGLVASPDGRKVLRGRTQGPKTEWSGLAEGLVEDLSRQGARELFVSVPPGGTSNA